MIRGKEFSAMYNVIRRLFPAATVEIGKAATEKVAASGGNRIVLLLGFGGAPKRFLRPIADWHNCQGRHTVSFTMPLAVPAIIRQLLEDEIVRQVHEVHCSSSSSSSSFDSSKDSDRESEFRSRPSVIVHSFSNNGIWVYGSLKRRDEFDIDKVMIDSAPTLWYEDLPIMTEVSVYGRILTSIFASTSSGPVYYHPIITPLVHIPIYAATIFSRALEVVESWIGSTALVPSYVGINRYLRDHFTKPGTPTLFLYSNGDTLVEKEHVENFIEIQRQKNLKLLSGVGADLIHQEIFEGISHVALWSRARQQYTSRINSFLS